MKRYLSPLLKLAITIASLVYLLTTNKLDLPRTLFLLRRPGVMVSVLLLLLTVTCLGAYRWRLLLACSATRVPLGSMLRLTLIGNFFNFVVPGGVGGDLVKTYYLVKREAVQSATAISSVVVDRFVGTSVLIAIGIVSLFLSRLGPLLENGAFRSLWQILLVAYVVAVPLLLWALAHSKTKVGTNLLLRLPGHWGKRLADIRDAMLNFRHFKAAILLAAVHSVVIHGCVIAAFWVLGRALEIQLHWLDYATLVPIGLLTVAIPIAPAGIGVSHLAFFTLFSLANSQRGADLFSIFLMSQLLVALPGLFLYLMFFRNSTPTASSIR